MLPAEETRAKRAAYMREYNARPENKIKVARRNINYKSTRREALAAKELTRYYENRDEIRSKQADRRNKDIVATRIRNREYNAKWRDEHREELRTKAREYAKQPKERERQLDIKGRRRAKEKGSHTERISWKNVWERFDGTCPLCGNRLALGVEKFHFDHIIPIAQDGPHTTANLQVTHSLCNQRKNRKIC